MKRLALLGSTGSIGVQALQVAQHLGPQQIEVIALAARSNSELLEKQARLFKPKMVAVFDEDEAKRLRQRLGGLCEVVSGLEGLNAVATHPDANFTLSAISGAAGLIPTVKAIEAGKDIGLANKEVLVSGGEVVLQALKESKSQILPIDSEHSALFQCLNGESIVDVRRFILTASGGPFRAYSEDRLEAITVKEALAHPNWNMGAKVTVDCSTLMNKGLEVIEAHYLFNIPKEKIEVVVHPQSIIHSMVEFVDGAIKAQMSQPDMMLPIQYAMTYPHRFLGTTPPFDFTKAVSLEFHPPDLKKFPCLRLAFDALLEGGLATCYLNAANEVLVSRFLKGEISWLGISKRLENLLEKQRFQGAVNLDAVLGVDAKARIEAQQV